MTIGAIARAQLAADIADTQIVFTVFDDASTDGTVKALASMSQHIEIILGSGNAYWAASMATAEAEVLQDISPESAEEDDYLVWLNDDVVLDVDAFLRLKKIALTHPASIIVGSMRDPTSGQITYSGMRRSGFHPLRFEIQVPSAEPQTVDTFNGNLVFVPVKIARALGGIDGKFAHAFADIDYGVRANKSGIPVILAPGSQGSCPRNPVEAPTSANSDWEKFRSRKGGGNYSSLRRILRKSHRFTWSGFIFFTYTIWWLRRIPLLLGVKRSS